MVLRLAGHLGVPLRERNELLVAAGLAPAFEQRALAEPALAAIRAAAERILEMSEPFPAVVLDRRRDVVLANRAAALLQEDIDLAALGEPLNALRLLLHPRGLAPRILGFSAYAAQLVERHRRDAATSGDPALRALIAEVERYPGVERAAPPPSGDAALVLRLRDPRGVLAFFTTIAAFGTPLDVTVSELVLESLFPADAGTADRLRERAARGG
jgi:hypothetical protein